MLLLLLLLLLDDIGVVVEGLVELELLHFFTVLYLLVLWDALFRQFLAEEIVISKLGVTCFINGAIER